MDQFDAIARKNRRLVRLIVIGVPLVLVAATFLFSFLPTIMKARDLIRLEAEIARDQSIDSAKAGSYLQQLQADPELRELMAGDEDYNLALLGLYLKQGDYDSVIACAKRAIERADFISYHYYLGYAYFEKGRYAEAAKEEESVAASPYQEKLAGLQSSARAMVGILNFHQYVSEYRLNAASADLLQLGAYLGPIENDEARSRLASTDVRYNTLSLEYYLRRGDWERVRLGAEKAIRARDMAVYHYYLARAWDESGRSQAALGEMKAFLGRDKEAAGGTVDEGNDIAIDRGRVFAAKYVGDDYHARGDYAAALRSYADALRAGASEGLLKEFASLMIDRQEHGVPLLSDRDQDGLSDELEGVLGTGQDIADSDADGFTDAREFLFGHDPQRTPPDDKLSEADYCGYFRKVLAVSAVVLAIQ